MAEYVQYNANPINRRAGDCTVRAISKALDQSWEYTFLDMSLQGLVLYDMQSANHVWGSYLRTKGFERKRIPDSCPDCYTVKDFCDDHPKGTYILAISGHVVTVIDGAYYDTWDSGDELPIYYWQRKED